MRPTAGIVENWDDFCARVDALTRDGRCVVLCHGDFDLMHAGHIERLEAARREGDVLVATVSDDGADSTVLPAELRARTLAALPMVQAVAVAPLGHSLESILREVRPSVVVPGLDALDTHAEVVGGLSAQSGEASARVHSLPASTFRQRVIDDRKRPGQSTADLFLKEFRQRWSAEVVIDKLKELSGLRVLVIGDTILDEYHYCRPYGMPLKSPIIAAESLGSELYAGGILAVANHVANFCGSVHLLTVLGEADSREDFVRAHLKPNIVPHLLQRPGAPTILKRRYVQKFLMRKLFEVSYFDVKPLPPAIEAQAIEKLEQLLPDFDLVLVADFGHGTITPRMVNLIAAKAKYLALNTQLNSVNFGYHVVTAYPRADYVCIDEEETRLAARDRYGPLEEMLPDLAARLNCQAMTVTRGHRGSLTWTPAGDQVVTPVLSTEVIDTIGAGDAYLAISAPCARAGFPPELVAFIGNCAGALAVRIVGNAASVEKADLHEFIRTALR